MTSYRNKDVIIQGHFKVHLFYNTFWWVHQRGSYSKKGESLLQVPDTDGILSFGLTEAGSLLS